MAGEPVSSSAGYTDELWRSATSEQPMDTAPILARTAARLSKLDSARIPPVKALIELLADKDWPTPPSVIPRAIRALEHLCDAADRGASAEAFDLSDILLAELELEFEGHQEFQERRNQLEKQPRLNGPDLEAALSEARRAARAKIQERRYLQGKNWWARFKEKLGVSS